MSSNGKGRNQNGETFGVGELTITLGVP